MYEWQNVEWEYSGGFVYCRIEGKVAHICDVAIGVDMSEVDAKGNAIVQCWNTRLAADKAMQPHVNNDC